MSLKALAAERLALLRGDETTPETTVKQVQQEPSSVFHREGSVSPLMKQDFPQKSAKNDACFTVSRTRGGNSETSPLPPDIQDGLDRLCRETAPRISQPRAWSVIVADALRLVSEGWAAQALGLGWSPVHLWGCSPRVGGNHDQDGLAVILAGRRVILLDGGHALIEDGKRRELFNVRKMPGAVLLWEIV